MATATEAPSESTATTEPVEPTETLVVEETPSEDSGSGINEPDFNDPRYFGRPLEAPEHLGGQLIQGADYEPDGINPIVDWYPDGTRVIFEPRCYANPETFEPVGNLATGWEVSDEGTAWTVMLREGVLWHDGETFGADDVKVTYDLMMNPDGPSYEVAFFSGVIDSTEVVDDLTVQFNLKTPAIDFISTYCTDFYTIVADHIFGSIPPGDIGASPVTTGEDPAMVVGTGPFKFVEWVRGDHMTCARNEEYWAGAPFLDEYVYRYLTDQLIPNVLLLSGELDYYDDVDPSGLPDIEASGNFTVSYSVTGYIRYIALNLDPARTEKFQDVRVRKALLYAIDRQGVIDAAEFGLGNVPIGLMHPASWALDTEAITVRYEYDPDMSGQLMEEAGYSRGADGFWEKDGQVFGFSLLCTPGRAAICEVIQEFWRQNGFDVQIEIVEPGLGDRLLEHDFEAAFWSLGWFPGSPDQASWFLSTQAEGGFNFSGYNNPEVDEIILAAQTEQDRDARRELSTQYQNIVLEDLPILPISLATDVHAVNNRCHNVFPTANYSETSNANTWWVDPL